MKIPGPDHPITITPSTKRLRVTFAGKVVADSTRTRTLKEANYPAVHYFPRGDADMSAFVRTDHHTHCPYKGDASYFTLTADGDHAVNAVWSYEAPYPAMAEIKDYLAFYPNCVDAIEEV